MISVKNLSHTYMIGTQFEKTALKNINFDVFDGEIVAIAGHTGSGKSTLIQIIAGLLKFTVGSVKIDDLDVFDKKIRKLVGIVFQYPENQLFEETIELDIGFAPKNLGLSDSEVNLRVEEAMKLVGLDFSLKKVSPFEISGGERRKVAIAGILAMKPRYLILDEPTAGLDPFSRRNLLKNLFCDVKKSCKTIILVSHNMEDVAKYANRVIVLAQGEILFTGTPRELFFEEKTLKRAGLEPPSVTKLILELGIKKIALTIDEAEKMIYNQPGIR